MKEKKKNVLKWKVPFPVLSIVFMFILIVILEMTVHAAETYSYTLSFSFGADSISNNYTFDCSYNYSYSSDTLCGAYYDGDFVRFAYLGSDGFLSNFSFPDTDDYSESGNSEWMPTTYMGGVGVNCIPKDNTLTFASASSSFNTFSTSLPLFSSSSELWNYLKTGDDSAQINKSESSNFSISTGTYDSSLNFSNFSYQELNGIPHKHFFSWDYKDAYDENTYIRMFADIKWTRLVNGISTQYSANKYQLLSESNGYLASNTFYQCDFPYPWQTYLDSQGIEYSSLTTQYTDIMYFQVVKYHPDTNTWSYSDVRYYNLAKATTGHVYVGVSSGTTITPSDDVNDWVNEEPDSIIDSIVGSVIDPEDDPFTQFQDATANYSFSFYNTLATMISSVGQVPAFVASLFGFLPGTLVMFIAAAVGAVVILRFLGR